MIYQKYFKPGQKVLLRAKQPPPPEGRYELLSAVFENGEADCFDLCLPYGPDAVRQFAFGEDMPFELSTDALGLGLKVSVAFLKPLSGNQIRVKVLPDLQMFQRRLVPRLDCVVGIRFTRGHKSLNTLRQTWGKNASILSSAKASPVLEGFNHCQLNLCPAGIRFSIHPPAEPTDLCLMLLELGDSKPPICALAEIVWVSGKLDDGTLHAGMQFINILEQDQKRIARFIRDRDETLK